MEKYKTYCVLARARSMYGKALIINVPVEVTLDQVTDLVKSMYPRGVAASKSLRDLKILTNRDYLEREFEAATMGESRSADSKKLFMDSKFDEFIEFMQKFNSRWLADQFGLKKSDYKIKETFEETYKVIGGKLKCIKSVKLEA